MASTCRTGCGHEPVCPGALDANAITAVVVARHDDEQGWSRLCNGVILFDDGAALLPDGRLLSDAECPCATVDYWTALLVMQDTGVLWQSPRCPRCATHEVTLHLDIRHALRRLFSRFTGRRGAVVSLGR